MLMIATRVAETSVKGRLDACTFMMLWVNKPRPRMRSDEAFVENFGDNILDVGNVDSIDNAGQGLPEGVPRQALVRRT